ncbi:hypothetical protein Taro_045567 [Colocasia esculenta]|uniref:Uncharacterized protein n=1 Tax=Colocasia esculenta TaxID=4460 RepID=A0A843WXC8_COLES|nr:hypothetical protein [Colocasia esculenta]
MKRKMRLRSWLHQMLQRAREGEKLPLPEELALFYKEDEITVEKLEEMLEDFSCNMVSISPPASLQSPADKTHVVTYQRRNRGRGKGPERGKKSTLPPDEKSSSPGLDKIIVFRSEKPQPVPETEVWVNSFVFDPFDEEEEEHEEITSEPPCRRVVVEPEKYRDLNKSRINGFEFGCPPRTSRRTTLKKPVNSGNARPGQPKLNVRTRVKDHVRLGWVRKGKMHMPSENGVKRTRNGQERTSNARQMHAGMCVHVCRTCHDKPAKLPKILLEMTKDGEGHRSVPPPGAPVGPLRQLEGRRSGPPDRRAPPSTSRRGAGQVP